MAEYIKFRLTAAKASVTLAFLALLGGLVGPAEGEQRGPSAHASSFQWGDPIYLKLDGLQGATKRAFQTFEYKLNQALGSLSHKLNTTFYDKHKIDATFLKLDKASREFLKIESANAEFLKLTDAANLYMKYGSTATNSNELGGLTPDAFVQGHANVVSGAQTVPLDGKQHQLLQSPDGAITVSVMINGDGTESLVIHNGSSSPLSMVVDPTSVEYQLPAVQDTTITVGSVNPTVATTTPGTDGSHMLHIQIFPAGNVSEVMTLTFSSESPNANQLVPAVAQMLIGLL